MSIPPPAFTADELAAYGRDPDRLRRQCRFIARMDSRLGGRDPHERPIIVGGSAVEFYTTGGYASQDIDLVLFDPRAAEDLLDRSGFQREGRYWWSPLADLLIEFPGRTLTYAPGAYNRVWEVEVEPEETVLIIGLEDILIGRIYSGASEGRINDLKWAVEMAALHLNRLDRTALEELARKNGISQPLAQVLTEAESIIRDGGGR